MKRVTEAELAKELREQYMKNPPEGMTSDEVRDMSDDDLLDHLLTLNRLIAMPAFQRVFFFSNFLNHTFSYKVK